MKRVQSSQQYPCGIYLCLCQCVCVCSRVVVGLEWIEWIKDWTEVGGNGSSQSHPCIHPFDDVAVVVVVVVKLEEGCILRGM